ncbi:hypothetical protein Efla_007803 [Eimeria flavescens]
MKPSSTSRSLRSRRAGDGPAGLRKQQFMSGSSPPGSAAFESAYAGPPPPYLLQEKEGAPTTSASSPRLSDAACSDTTASERLSSGEAAVPLSSRCSSLTGQQGLHSAASSFVLPASSSSYSSSSLQQLVLQGRVITDQALPSEASSRQIINALPPSRQPFPAEALKRNHELVRSALNNQQQQQQHQHQYEQRQRQQEAAGVVRGGARSRALSQKEQQQTEHRIRAFPSEGP